jgi:ribosomal protein S18 acetylase RimI-like enzyme
MVRRGTTRDVAAVLQLWRDAGAVPGTTDDTGGLQALLDFDAGAMLVAEVDGDVVGSLIAAWDGWRGNMYRLAVRPAHRRHGIASRLVRAGEERLRSLGCRRITALVVDEHDHAVALWTHVGYTRVPGTRRFVR